MLTAVKFTPPPQKKIKKGSALICYNQIDLIVLSLLYIIKRRLEYIVGLIAVLKSLKRKLKYPQDEHITKIAAKL